MEIYTYYIIKDQFKDNSLTASISEKELSTILNVSEITVKRYIKDLEPFFANVTKTRTTGEHYYNVYHFTQLNNDFSIVLHSLKDDTELTAEEKGILIKIKLQCYKGTNYIRYNSKAELTKIIGIGKNQITKKLKQLEDKGYICFIGKSLQLSTKHFPLSLAKGDSVDAVRNHIYETIYKYCIIKKTVPPLRDNKALGYLLAKYPNIDNTIAEALNSRCQTLPDDVSLDYFVKALTDKAIDRTIKTDFGFIL